MSEMSIERQRRRCPIRMDSGYTLRHPGYVPGRHREREGGSGFSHGVDGHYRFMRMKWGSILTT